MLQSVWRIRLLGGFQVDQGARTLPRFSTNQTALLLAIVADQVGRAIRRDELIELLWPGAEQDSGRNRLRVGLAYLRRILEPPGTPANSILYCDRSSVMLTPTGSGVDTEDFSHWIEKGRVAVDQEEVIRCYSIADQLYKGKFLPGWPGDWVQERQLYYARLQAQAQTRLSKLYEDMGDRENALRSALRASAADPLREVFVKRVLTLQLANQDLAGALDEYERYRSLLKNEVGLIPTYELRALAKRMKFESSVQRADGVPPASVSTEVPVQTVSESPQPSGRISLIPPTLTSFLGRSVEIQEVSDLILLHRWITVTGPGGIGKSRLASEVARRNEENFVRGVFVIVSPENPDPSTLLENLLGQLGISPSAEPFEDLRSYLYEETPSGRDAVLFVFDGFDQYPVVATEVLQRLLFELPNASILVTSRSRTGVVGECEYPLGRLTLPGHSEEMEGVSSNESVQLFVDRVRAFNPRFALTRTNMTDVAALCRRLDGVPLAIELAAAQSADATVQNVLLESQNLDVLRDRRNWRPLRHRSFVANLEASFARLTQHEQTVFCNLCVFRGSLDPTAAMIVAGATGDDLEKLTASSFLSRKPTYREIRYTIPELVREHGWSRFSPEEQSMALERHASYYRKLVRDVEILNVVGGLQQRVRLTFDLDNVRLAIATTLESEDADAIANLTMNLAWHWIYEGSQLEGRRFIETARERCNPKGLSAIQLEFAEGVIACFHDDHEVGLRRLNSSIPKLAAAGHEAVAMVGRVAMGYALYCKGDFEEYFRVGTKSQREFRERGMARWDGYECHLLGCTLTQMNRPEEATHWHLEAERLFREMGDLPFEGYPPLGLARVSFTQGDYAVAEERYRIALEAFRKWKDMRGICYALEGFGRNAAATEQCNRAAFLLGAVERMREQMGLVRDFADQRDYDEAMGRICENIGDAYAEKWAAGRRLTATEAADWALLGLKID